MFFSKKNGLYLEEKGFSFFFLLQYCSLSLQGKWKRGSFFWATLFFKREKILDFEKKTIQKKRKPIIKDIFSEKICSELKLIKK